MLVKYTVSEFLSAKGSFSSIDNYDKGTSNKKLSVQFNSLPTRVATLVVCW